MKKKTLVVDDSIELLFAMETILSFHDFEVRTAVNKKTFLNEVKSFKPHIVIMDVILSGDSGRDICKSFREDPISKNTTLILFSASPKRLLNFQECGADGIIHKPFSIKDLMGKIETSVQARLEKLLEEKWRRKHK
jgi:DNA-binding response OmpR family regulator